MKQLDDIKRILKSLAARYLPVLKKLLKNSLIIFEREFMGYFNSPVAYIIIIVFLLLCGWFFSSTLFILNQATIDPFLKDVPMLFALIIPGIAMRLFAEELKMGTIKILTTLPVRDYEIIAGKYLSVVALLAIAVVSTVVYPITVSFLGTLDWGRVIGSYTGLILLGASFSAIGLFASSLTRNQIVAFIIGFFVCFGFFMMGKILVFLPPFVVPVVEFLSIDSHFENISKGVIDSRDIIYYLSVSFFFLYASYTVVSSRRETKRFQMGVMSSAAVLIVLGILVFVNLLSYNIFWRLDLSEGNVYSLSRASINLMRNLDAPLLIKAYFTKDLPSPYNVHAKYLRDMLNEYKSYSRGKMKYRFIDPGSSEDLRGEAHVADIPPVRFTQMERDKYEIKEGFMGVSFVYTDKKDIIPIVRGTEGLEYSISSIIKHLTAAKKKKLVFLVGHDEFGVLQSQRFKEMISSHYETEDVNLMEDDWHLTNADALVIMGPKRPVSEDEQYKIDQFLMKGKTIAFLISKKYIDMRTFTSRELETGLDEMMKNYGVVVKDGYALDIQNQTIRVASQIGLSRMPNYVNYPFIPIATRLKKEHPIVKGMESLTLPFVSPIAFEIPEDSNLKGTVLIESSKKSWHEEEVVTFNPMLKFRYNEEKETPGPLQLAGVVEGRFKSFFPDREGALTESPITRIFVLGTADFLGPAVAGRGRAGVSFFLNMFDWLVQDEALISIRSKGVTLRPLKEVSAYSRTLIKYANIIIMPLVFVFYGLFRWRRRLSWKNRLASEFA